MFDSDPFLKCLFFYSDRNLKYDIVTLQCIPPLLGSLIGLALAFATTVAVIIIIISGIKFMTSGGDPKQAEGAQKTLTLAIVGLVLIILSFLILNVISYITNVDCIKTFGFDNCKVSTP